MVLIDPYPCSPLNSPYRLARPQQDFEGKRLFADAFRRGVACSYVLI